MVDLETKSPQTAYENDDKVFINSIVPLPVGSFNEFFATLYVQVIGGNIQILNRDSTGDDDQTVINWFSLGLNIGSTFEITGGANVGVYTVIGITSSLLTLAPVSIVPTYTGDVTLLMKYYYDTIFWQTETNQRVTVLSGLSNVDTYPNLFYSLRRIFAAWNPYFVSMCFRKQTKKIKNLMFRNNPKVKTQIGSGIIYDEKEDVAISSMGDPILSENKYDLEVKASFSDILNLLILLKTDRGFVRGFDLNDKIIKGYIQELEYTWKTGNLRLLLEEKYEADLIVLTYVPGLLTVNDTPYNLSGTVRWWKITGNYFECFDNLSMAICNIRLYSNVSLNGVIYNNVVDLENALLSLV